MSISRAKGLNIFFRPEAILKNEKRPRTYRNKICVTG